MIPTLLRAAGPALALLAGLAAPATQAQSVVKPDNIPFNLAKGKQQFEAFCSQCHGQWGEGSDEGPPLMHPYYKPSHHSDKAFVFAVKRGSHQHHWEFGPMEPIPEVSDQDIGAITRYVRWLQVQNGIQ